MAAPAAKRQRSAGTAAGAAAGGDGGEGVVVRVGVNGFGRIGRLITRIVFQRDDPRRVPVPPPPAQPQRPAPD